MLDAVLSTALPVHGLRKLSDAFHQGAAETLLGAAFLLNVGVVREHLFAFVDFELSVQLLQLILRRTETP